MLGAVLLCSAVICRAEPTEDYLFLLNLDQSELSHAPPDSWEFSLELNDTGIDSDNELRELLSASKMDLLTALDYFAVDLQTDSFDRYHSINLQYDTAPLAGDTYLALNGFYSFDRIPVPDSNEDIDDQSQGVAAYLMTLNAGDPWLINWGAGVRWQQTDTEDLLIYEGQGSNRFLLPGLQLQWQRESLSGYSARGSLLYEWNEPSLANTRQTSRTVMVPVTIGQTQTLVEAQASLDMNTRFSLLLADYEHRWYLGNAGKTRQHQQLVLALTWQSSFGEPLLPAFQRSIGGLYSVRGYDDQVFSGNDVLETTLEYRTRLFATTMADSQWQPWLLLFYDWAQARRDAINASISRTRTDFQRDFVIPEDRNTLRSVGLGIDLHYRRRSSLYLVVARALADDGFDTEAGDWRLHAYLRFYF